MRFPSGEYAIERSVAADLETGEFGAVPAVGAAVPAVDGPVSALRGEQRFGQRQVDQDRVSAEQQRDRAQTPIGADGR